MSFIWFVSSFSFYLNGFYLWFLQRWENNKFFVFDFFIVFYLLDTFLKFVNLLIDNLSMQLSFYMISFPSFRFKIIKILIWSLSFWLQRSLSFLIIILNKLVLFSILNLNYIFIINIIILFIKCLLK